MWIFFQKVQDFWVHFNGLAKGYMKTIILKTGVNLLFASFRFHLLYVTKNVSVRVSYNHHSCVSTQPTNNVRLVQMSYT